MVKMIPIRPIKVGEYVDVLDGKYKGRSLKVARKEGRWVDVEIEGGVSTLNINDVEASKKEYSSVTTQSLKKKLKDNNVDMREVASVLNLSVASISGYLRGEFVRFDHLEKIENAMDSILETRKKNDKQLKYIGVPDTKKILDQEEKEAETVLEVVKKEVAAMDDIDEEFEVLEDSNCVDSSTQNPSDAESMMSMIVEQLNIVEFCKLASMIVSKVEALNDVYKG